MVTFPTRRITTCCPQCLSSSAVGGSSRCRVASVRSSGPIIRPSGGKGKVVSEIVKRVASDDRGLSTAEYAVGTVAVAGLGGLLYKLLTSEFMTELLQRILEWAFSFLFQ